MTRAYVLALILGAAIAAPAEAGFCVTSRLDKGTWFAAAVSSGKGNSTTDFSHRPMYAGQTICTPDDHSTLWIKVEVAGGASASFSTKSKCQVDIWGTTNLMYFNETADCVFNSSYQALRGWP